MTANSTILANIERAQAAVARARESLDAALTEGGDTQAARSRMLAAEGRLADLEAASEATLEEETLDDLEDATDELVREATADLMAKLAAFKVPEPTLPELPVSLALAVIQARADDANIKDAIAAHEARGGTLRARLSAVQAKREALLERRLGGTEEADDAATLALLDADARGLQDLLHRHEALRPEDPNRSAAALVHWTSTLRLAYLSSLKTHAEALQQAMLAAAKELAAQARSDTHLRLRPDPALARAVSVGVF
jgi:hypothetical protein